MVKRRTFMKVMGFVPAIVPTVSGVLEQDGSTIHRLGVRDAVGSTVFTYGRVEMTSKAIASFHREAFIEHLDRQLQSLRRDYIRHYDGMVAGTKPVAWGEEKERFIESYL